MFVEAVRNDQQHNQILRAFIARMRGFCKFRFEIGSEIFRYCNVCNAQAMYIRESCFRCDVKKKSEFIFHFFFAVLIVEHIYDKANLIPLKSNCEFDDIISGFYTLKELTPMQLYYLIVALALRVMCKFYNQLVQMPVQSDMGDALVYALQCVRTEINLMVEAFKQYEHLNTYKSTQPILNKRIEKFIKLYTNFQTSFQLNVKKSDVPLLLDICIKFRDSHSSSN